MFDQIICKKELPLNEELKSLNVQWNKVNFQTKDLDNCLCDYIITEDGELVEDVKKYEYTYYTKKEIKQRAKKKKWSFVKDSKLIDEYTKKVDYHGKILFYEIFKLSEDEDLWVEFEACFVYGKLDKIELVKTEKQEARSIRMDQWWEEEEKRKNSWNYKLKTYSGWYWGWKQLSNFFYNGSKLFGNLQTFAIRRLH